MQSFRRPRESLRPQIIWQNSSSELQTLVWDRESYSLNYRQEPVTLIRWDCQISRGKQGHVCVMNGIREAHFAEQSQVWLACQANGETDACFSAHEFDPQTDHLFSECLLQETEHCWCHETWHECATSDDFTGRTSI